MFTPDFKNYEGFMDYETYKNWVSNCYSSGSRWNSEIDWKFATDTFYANKPSRRTWEKHVENGGSHWTLFSNDGWQMAPDTTKKWKNRTQTRIRRMIRQDEFHIYLDKEDPDDKYSDTTESTEDEYWKD